MHETPGSPSDRLCQLALTMAPGVGPVTARRLIEYLGSSRAVIEADPAILSKIEGVRSTVVHSLKSKGLLEEAENELEYAKKHRIDLLGISDPGYPPLLRECSDAPVILFCRGHGGLQSPKCLSVVGTRRATSYGRDLCDALVRGLAEQINELVIVSGLAYGIDVQAHRAALEYGLNTVAVLGHGLDTVYPREHRSVAGRITGQGALVTDFPSKSGPEPGNFVRRNRIIAGLSHATLVIESGIKGGALLTARMASSYHRDVLAVPGKIGDRWSEGCNRMIKCNLAALVESPEDIMECLGWKKERIPGEPHQAPGKALPHTDESRKILNHLSRHPGDTPGKISGATGLPLSRVLADLVELELQGSVTHDPGNRYRLRIGKPYV